MAFLGEIRLIAGKVAPTNWRFCDGGLLPISKHQSLYLLLDTTYYSNDSYGNGRSTFALPDLRGRVPIQAGNGESLSNYTLGQRGGVENVALTEAQIPYHAHAIIANGENNGTSTADLKVSDSAGDESNPATAKSIAGRTHLAFKTLSSTDATTVLKNCVTGIDSSAKIPSNTENTGGLQPHYNMQPYLVINYIIFCPEE